MGNRTIARVRYGWLHLVLRLFVGGILLFSAVSKLPNHTEFVGIVKDYDLLPDALATAYANALPWAELFIGVYLVLGVLIRFSALVAILMGTSFLIGNAYAISRGDDYCGGCFGDVWTLPPWESLTIDMLLLLASIMLLLPALNKGPCIGLDYLLQRDTLARSEESK